MKINSVSRNVNSIKQNKTKINFKNNTQRIAVYAGSFDPITNGHLDLIKEASKLFDELIVLIAKNAKKTGFLPINTRLDLIKECISTLKNVTVDTYEGLTINYAKEHNANYLVRGVRSNKDFEDETNLSNVNKMLAPEITTVLLVSNPTNSSISSSVVRELLAHNCSIENFVPSPVNNYFINQHK